MGIDNFYGLIDKMIDKNINIQVPIISKEGSTIEPSLLTTGNQYVHFSVNETFDVYDIWTGELEYKVPNYPVAELLREIQAYSDTHSADVIKCLCNFVYVLSAFPAIYYPYSTIVNVENYTSVQGVINEFLNRVAEDNSILLPCEVNVGDVIKSIEHPIVDRFDLDMSFIRFVHEGIAFAAFTSTEDTVCLARTCESGYVSTSLKIPVMWGDIQLFNKVRDIMLNALLGYCGIIIEDDKTVPINFNVYTNDNIDSGLCKSGLSKLSDVVKWLWRFNS